MDGGAEATVGFALSCSVEETDRVSRPVAVIGVDTSVSSSSSSSCENTPFEGSVDEGCEDVEHQSRQER